MSAITLKIEATEAEYTVDLELFKATEARLLRLQKIDREALQHLLVKCRDPKHEAKSTVGYAASKIHACELNEDDGTLSEEVRHIVLYLVKEGTGGAYVDTSLFYHAV
jgi:hypothetical protein